jgi:hypothetical protein
MDGISDDDELVGGLNLLDINDGHSDTDNDGLPLVMELNRGLDPGDDDTDGDGRTDDAEVADGTDPLVSDSPLPADTLTAYPDSLSFETDYALDTPNPQALVNLLSHEPVTWTLTADVEWLAASRVTGQTPGSTTIIMNKDKLLADGVYTGNLFFTSSLGTVTVPVSTTVTNSPTTKIFLPVIVR